MENIEVKIEELTKELLAYDKNFMAHEAELKKIIRQLLMSKPDTKFDQQFAENLRRQLLIKAENLKTASSPSIWKSWRTLLVPAMAVAVLVLGGVYINNKNNKTVIETPLLSDKIEIDSIGKNAFGKIALNDIGSGGTGRGGGGGSEALSAAPADAPKRTDSSENQTQAGVAADSGTTSNTGNTSSLAMPSVVASPIATGMGGGGDAKIIAPYPNYRYVYKGEPLKLTDTEVSVYKRQKGLTSSAASQFIKQLRFGLVDMTKFNNVDVDLISLMEKKEYGYNLTINFREGVIAINENWELWPTPDKQCQTPECYDALRLKPSDVPGDQEILSIASKFLSDYNISTANYGQPQIMKFWQRDLEMATDKTQVYIPDVVSVIYPLIIEGQQVYDESGSPAGLAVNVNIRVKKASGVQELAVQKYQASSYPAETDESRIIKLAENGGFRTIYYAQEGVKTEDIELGTPTKSLVKIWQYKNGTSDELYIPALVFPVTSAPKDSRYGYFYKTNVIVPLAKEILDDANNGGGPIPLMK